MSMLPFMHQSGFAPDGLLMLVFGLGLDAVFGEMGLLLRLLHLPHPGVVLGNLIAAAERRLNRLERGDTDRRVRGVLVALLIPGGAAAFGFAVAWGARHIGHVWPVEVLLIALSVSQKSLRRHVRDVARALAFGGLATGRQAVGRIVGRDPETLDEYGVARAAIESLAENFGDGVVGPVFWYMLLGLPGMLAFKAINTLDSMVGHRTERYRAFGWASARLDDLVNLVPARLAGLMIAAGAVFTADGRAGNALVTMRRDAMKHASPNSGWPEAAMAGALGLALGGPRHYPGRTVNDGWMGLGRTEAGIVDIERALGVFFGACIVNATVVVMAIRLAS